MQNPSTCALRQSTSDLRVLTLHAKVFLPPFPSEAASAIALAVHALWGNKLI
jgi:hypothetical protein